MRAKRPVRIKKGQWFIKLRGSYIPCSREGWLLYVPYMAYLMAVPAYTVYRHYDLLFSLFIVLPNYIAALVIMTWFAERKS